VNEFGYVLKNDRCVLRFSETISVENRSCVSLACQHVPPQQLTFTNGLPRFVVFIRCEDMVDV
jgi:hypothetical protein